MLHCYATKIRLKLNSSTGGTRGLLRFAADKTSIELVSIPDSLWDKEQAIEMADFVLTQKECDDGIVGTAVKNTQEQDLKPYMPLSKKQKPNN